MGAQPEILPNYVGGRWIASQTADFFDVHNPARGEVTARTPVDHASLVLTCRC